MDPLTPRLYKRINLSGLESRLEEPLDADGPVEAISFATIGNLDLATAKRDPLTVDAPVDADARDEVDVAASVPASVVAPEAEPFTDGDTEPGTEPISGLQLYAAGIPCFVAGTRIHTPKGRVAVEDLRCGDLVETRDHGPQPLRWTGAHRVSARGRLAPVRIAAGALGAHGAVSLSRQHRVLIRGWGTEMLFGEGEVLVAARLLLDDTRIRVDDRASVDYCHILFDRHEIVMANGLPVESVHPGDVCLTMMEHATREELDSIFLKIAQGPGTFGATARRVLTPWECRLVNSEAARLSDTPDTD